MNLQESKKTKRVISDILQNDQQMLEVFCHDALERHNVTKDEALNEAIYAIAEGEKFFKDRKIPTLLKVPVVAALGLLIYFRKGVFPNYAEIPALLNKMSKSKMSFGARHAFVIKNGKIDNAESITRLAALTMSEKGDDFWFLSRIENTEKSK